MNLKRLAAIAVALLALAFFIQPAFAQSTIATGNIQGSVTDPQGAGVPNAKVTITSKDTGEVVSTVTTSSGNYNSGGLKPGCGLSGTAASRWLRAGMRTSSTRRTGHVDQSNT